VKKDQEQHWREWFGEQTVESESKRYGTMENNNNNYKNIRTAQPPPGRQWLGVGRGSHNVIEHVTVRFAVCHFLLVVHWNRASICNRFRDIRPDTMFTNTQTNNTHRNISWRSGGNLRQALPTPPACNGSRDVIRHVTIGFSMCHFLLVFHCNGGSISNCL